MAKHVVIFKCLLYGPVLLKKKKKISKIIARFGKLKIGVMREKLKTFMFYITLTLN